jgi:hypothetical protein
MLNTTPSMQQVAGPWNLLCHHLFQPLVATGSPLFHHHLHVSV